MAPPPHRLAFFRNYLLLIIVGILLSHSSVLSVTDVRLLQGEDPNFPYDTVYNESSFFPGKKRSYGGFLMSVSWYRQPKVFCPQANNTLNTFNFADTPLYALTTINNTVTLIGMISFRTPANDYYLNSTIKLVEPIILTSSNVGKTWTCTVLNSTDTITTYDIFRTGAAVTSYIYPPPPTSMTIPRVRLATPSLTTNNVPLQCNLLCIMGGLYGPQGSFDTYYTNKVTCSKDNGNTWYFTASLPTTIVRASAIQFNQELLILGGQRGDSSANILAAVWDYTICNITGWTEYAPASPVTDRFDLSINTIWNNQSQSMELWAGGGKNMVGGSPLRSLDLWRTTTPFDRASWVRVGGILPVSVIDTPADEGWGDFSAMTTRTGIPWGYQHGVCDPFQTAPIDATKLCYDSLFLLNSDLTYVFLRDLKDDWTSFQKNYLYFENSRTNSIPPRHRRSVFVHDDEHEGVPMALTFDTTSGEVWRVDTISCLDFCPEGTWTHSCRFSPFDALCRPCSRCKQGYYAEAPCEEFVDTECTKCTVCNPDQIIIHPCNPMNNTVCGYEMEYYLDSDSLIVNKGKLNYVYYAILGCVGLLIVTLTVSPILVHNGKNGDSNNTASNDSLTVNNYNRNLPNGNDISQATDVTKGSILISLPFTFRSYILSIVSNFRIILPLMGTVAHYVCYTTLTIALWSAPKLYMITSLLIICLVVGPIINTFLLWYTTKGQIIGNGKPISVWKPSSGWSSCAFLFSILHPRVLLSILPGSSIINRNGLNSEKLPYQRYKRSLYWTMVSSVVQDVPPVMGCMLTLGAVSLPSAAPAILLCASLGILNLFVTFAWTMSAYIRSGMLSKFSSNNYSIEHNHDTIGEVVNVDNTIIPEQINRNNNQLNPIAIISHNSSHVGRTDTVPSSRDSIAARRGTKPTYSSTTTTVPGLSNHTKLSDLSPSSSTSSITTTLEKQASIVESLRHKLATHQPISDQETAQAAVLLTGLQGKASELLNILANVVQQTEVNNDENIPSVNISSVSDTVPSRITSDTGVVRMVPNSPVSLNPLSNNTVNRNSTSSIPNPNNVSGRTTVAPSVPSTNNNVGNFFVGFGTTMTNEQPYLDRVITELTAPIEVEDSTAVLPHTPSPVSSLVNHSVNPHDNQVSEGIRSRSTSISIPSEIGIVPLSALTPLAFNGTSVRNNPASSSSTVIGHSTEDAHHPLHSRISRVVRSLTPK